MKLAVSCNLSKELIKEQIKNLRTYLEFFTKTEPPPAISRLCPYKQSNKKNYEKKKKQRVDNRGNHHSHRVAALLVIGSHRTGRR